MVPSSTNCILYFWLLKAKLPAKTIPPWAGVDVSIWQTIRVKSSLEFCISLSILSGVPRKCTIYVTTQMPYCHYVTDLVHTSRRQLRFSDRKMMALHWFNGGPSSETLVLRCVNMGPQCSFSAMPADGQHLFQHR